MNYFRFFVVIFGSEFGILDMLSWQNIQFVDEESDFQVKNKQSLKPEWEKKGKTYLRKVCLNYLLLFIFFKKRK